VRVGVIGAGKWGQALQFALSQKSSVNIYSRTRREISNFVDLDTILDSDYLVFAISTQSVSNWLEENFEYRGQKILIASKGIEVSTGRLLTEIFEQHLPSENIAFLSGPSFADEVKKSLPTALVVSSKSEFLPDEFGRLFPDFIKIYSDSDVIGAEVAGAYKNILAIASGVSDGLQLGNNARASLIARGLVEMERFGERYGAKLETFFGLSGAGDLFLTASSTLSRNYRVGLKLTENKSMEQILEELGEVAEGVKTVRAIMDIAERESLYLPIAKEVFLMVNGKSPKESLKDLLST
jgi:glycerol-3-phosphate dehydrogenase (NAD(P)+)